MGEKIKMMSKLILSIDFNNNYTFFYIFTIPDIEHISTKKPSKKNNLFINVSRVHVKITF